MPDPVIEPEKQANAVTPTTVWQNPETKPVAEHGKMYKYGLIAGGVLIFIVLALLIGLI